MEGRPRISGVHYERFSCVLTGHIYIIGELKNGRGDIIQQCKIQKSTPPIIFFII